MADIEMLTNEERYLKVRAYIRAGLVSALWPIEFENLDYRKRLAEPTMLQIVDRHIDALPPIK